MCTTMYVLSKNIENIKFFSGEIFIFTAEKNLCLLHGHVFVKMSTNDIFSESYEVVVR